LRRGCLGPSGTLNSIMRRFLASVLACAWLSACGGCGGSAPSAAPVQAGSPRTVTLNTSLSSPWGLAFLPDGRMLVTQKGGTMVVLAADGASVQATLAGLPAVVSDGQGGLMDVALDPDFATDPWAYWAYSEPGTGAEAGLSGTAVARGRLVGDALQGVAVIYRQVPKVSGAGHFGSRLAFRGDKTSS
jgi:glucose/arabinose dehydrogenase